MKIKFVPQNIELEINPNQSVLDLAQQNDIHIQSVCKGIPSCAECRVYIKEGEHNVMPPQPKELELIGTAYFVDQRRLSCQLRCFGDVVIDLTEQIEKQNKSTKNPQGRYVKERENSQARMGNILEELKEEELKFEEQNEIEKSLRSENGSQAFKKNKIDNKSFYADRESNSSESKNSNVTSNNNNGSKTQFNASANNPNAQSKSSKRNRNRRRNKNKKLRQENSN